MFRKILILLFCFNFCLSYTQDKILNTNPTNASVYDENDELLGQTPFKIEKIGEYKLKIKKIAYEATQIEIKNTSRAINIEDCLVSSENILFTKSANSLIINLIPKKLSSENKIIIGFKNPVIDIDKEIVLGTVNKDEKKLKDKKIHILLGYAENMENRIYDVFKNSFIQPIFFDDNKQTKDKSLLLEPKVVFKPVINKINFNLTGKEARDYNGFYSIQIDWKVFSRNDLENPKIIYSTNVNAYRVKNNYNLLLHDLVCFSQLELLKNQNLYIDLKKIEEEYINESIGARVDVPLILSEKKEPIEISNCVNSVVTIETENSFGSGFFINNEGYILTNYHVKSPSNELVVKYNNQQVKAQIVASNKSVDLLLLKIDDKGVALPISKNSNKIGQDVYAIGTPVDRGLDKTVTKGIISNNRVLFGVNFIQTDVSINPGNSGGPLLNKFGEIIGINTLKLDSENTNGIGFAIDINFAIKMLNINQ